MVGKEAGSKLYRPWLYSLAVFAIEVPLKLMQNALVILAVHYFCAFREDGLLPLMAVTSVLSVAGLGLGAIIGCLFDDIATCISMQVVTTVPVFVFGGLLLNNQTLPNYIYWAQFLSPMRYASVILARRFFEGETFIGIY
jgi:ABC-type multidrug transport system permease subunit